MNAGRGLAYRCRSAFAAQAGFLGVLVVLALVLPEPARAGVFNPQTFRLDNGLQVVVVPNHRVPVVTQMVWYKAGSADEPPGKSGVAHLLEHLMFKGTKTLAPGEFSRILARNGGRENAFTSYDYTGYYQTVALDRLELVMEMESDRMTNLVITEDELETERRVILEERRLRVDNDPSSILAEQANAALFMNHPYRRPIIGWEHEIRAIEVDDVRQFYRRWYTPKNAVLVVAGDITAEELRPLAERTYGRIPAPPATPRKRPSEPPQKVKRRVTLRDSRVRQPSWSRTVLAPSYTTGETEHAHALEVLARILGGGATSRIYRSLVVEGKLAVSAGVSYDADPLGPSRFSFYASPRPGVTMEAIEAAMDAEVEKLLRDGVSDEEVARAKKHMQADAVYARDSLRTGARVLGSALAAGRTVEDVETWPERIGAVDAARVNAAARAVIEAERSVTALLLPEED